MKFESNNWLAHVFLWVAGCFLTVFPENIPASAIACQSHEEPAKELIDSLIRQLDDDSFQAREAAEKSLAKFGFPAARFLVEHVLSEEPEIAIRCGRVLCEIASSAESEDELSRIAAVLEYLSRNGFHQYGNSARQAIARWKEGRAEKVRERIRATGIEIDVQEVLDGELMFLRGGFTPAENLAAVEPQAANEKRRSPGDVVTPPREEMIAEIDKILAGEEKSIAASLTGRPDSNPATGDLPLQTRVFVEGGGRVLVVGGNGTILAQQPTCARIARITSETVEGIKLMRELAAVHQITFEDCEIPTELISELEMVPGLQMVVITRCKYDPVPFLELSKRMPNVSMTATGHPAFLGISVQEELGYDESGEAEPRLVIQTVVEDSGAEEAGIKVGDIFLSIDGTPISSHGQMVIVIGSRQPGDVLTIRIQSDGEEKEIKATLKTRPPGV